MSRENYTPELLKIYHSAVYFQDLRKLLILKSCHVLTRLFLQGTILFLNRIEIIIHFVKSFSAILAIINYLMNTFDTTFCPFYQILIVITNRWQCNELKRRKNAFSSREPIWCHSLPYITPFLNKTSLSNSFSLLRSGFHGAIYDASKFLLVLAFFGAFEIIVHVKQWPTLFRRCFNGSGFLVGLLC